MLVCETWLANDFLARHGYPIQRECGCPECPPISAPIAPRSPDFKEQPIKGEMTWLEKPRSPSLATW